MARSFMQLSLDERRIIAQMNEKKISQFVDPEEGRAAGLGGQLASDRREYRGYRRRKRLPPKFAPAGWKEFGHWETGAVHFCPCADDVTSPHVAASGGGVTHRRISILKTPAISEGDATVVLGHITATL